MAEITLTKDNFDEVVLKADKPVLVDFWATWCGPCRMVGPIIERIATEQEGVAIVGKVNVDEEEEIAERYGIMSIPTLMVFKNGEAVKTSVGAQPKEKIEAMLLDSSEYMK